MSEGDGGERFLSTSKYSELGVEAQKAYQGKVFSKEEGMFPYSFVDIYQRPHCSDLFYCHVGDGAGSKPVQSYLHMKETNDVTVFRGLAQDTVAMNVGDAMACNITPISFIDYVAINGFDVPKKEVLKELSKGFSNTFSAFRTYAGIDINFSGGETADLPDQIQTIDVSGALYAEQEGDLIIKGNVEPGNLIIGVRSGGKAVWEEKENSGIMCNGITLARHATMKAMYGHRYPEITSPAAINRHHEKHGNVNVYYGEYEVTDKPKELNGMSVSEAILSPTRQFGIVMGIVAKEFGQDITAIVHNTGGGMTKSLRVGKGIHYIKDNLFKPDPIFNIIQEASGEKWRDMYQDFNMGCGMEIMAPTTVAISIIDRIEKLGIKADVIGHCEKTNGENIVTLRTRHGNYVYP